MVPAKWTLLPSGFPLLGPADHLCILLQHALPHCLPDSICKHMHPSSSHTHPEYITYLISVHRSFPCTSKALSTFMFAKILFMLLGLATLISSKFHYSPNCAPLATYSSQHISFCSHARSHRYILRLSRNWSWSPQVLNNVSCVESERCSTCLLSWTNSTAT